MKWKIKLKKSHSREAICYPRLLDLEGNEYESDGFPIEALEGYFNPFQKVQKKKVSTATTIAILLVSLAIIIYLSIK